MNRKLVARVDNAELSADELAAARDSLRATPGQTQEFVDDWVVNELLYQEANRRGLADRQDVRREVESARKRLMVSALLEKEVYDGDTSQVSEAAVDSFYRTSGTSLALPEDVVNISFVLFAERDAANAFRATVLRGKPWADALLACQKDSATRPLLLGSASHQYFSQSTLYPEELWKLSRTLGNNEVSFVVKTNAGYYVLKVHGVKHQGEKPDLDYVRNEIRDRILIEQRRAKYEKLVADLRARHSVEILIGRSDTAAPASE